MNNNLIINTNLLRKEPEFRTRTCVVEKAIAVSHAEFDNMKRNPLQYNDLIADNVDLMYCDSDDNYHCLLIYDEEYGDGLLIEAEGSFCLLKRQRKFLMNERMFNRSKFMILMCCFSLIFQLKSKKKTVSAKICQKNPILE